MRLWSDALFLRTERVFRVTILSEKKSQSFLKTAETQHILNLRLLCLPCNSLRNEHYCTERQWDK